MIQDWIGLKDQHQSWPRNYLRRWLETKRTQEEVSNQEIKRIGDDIQNLAHWPESSRTNIQTWLLKYTLFLTRNNYFSPAQLLKEFESLLVKSKDITEPEKLKEEIKQRATKFNSNENTNKQQVGDLLQQLDNDQVLVQDLDMSIETSRQELSSEEDSRVKLVCQMIESLQNISSHTKKQKNVLDMIFEFLAFLTLEEKSPSLLENQSAVVQEKHIERKYVECISKLVLPAGRSGVIGDPVTLVTSLLQSADGGSLNESELKLIATVDICTFAVKLKTNNLNAVKGWADLLNRLHNKSISSDFTSSIHQQPVAQVQEAFIQLCYSLLRQNYKEADDFYATSHLEQCIENLAMVTKFLTLNKGPTSGSHYDTNRLFLDGLLITLAEQLDSKTKSVEEFISTVIKKIVIGQYQQSKIRLAIISFIYSTEKARPLEVAFLKRWILSESASDGSTVLAVCDALSYHNSNINRFWTKMNDIWTQEEVKYIDIIGKEVANDLLHDKNPVEFLYLLKEAAVKQVKECLSDALKLKVADVDAVKESFDREFQRSRSAAQQDKVEYEWLIWLRDVVLKTLTMAPGRLTSTALVHLLSITEDYSFEEVLHSTSTSRPHQWIDDLLITSFTDSLVNVYGDRDRAIIKATMMDLRTLILRLQSPAKKLLHLLRNQLDEEFKLRSKMGDKYKDLLKKLFESLKKTDKLSDEIIKPFMHLPLSRWPRRLRHLQLSHQWSKELANRLAKLDSRFGLVKTDQFIDNFNKNFSSADKETKLSVMSKILKHLFKYSWLLEDIDPLMMVGGASQIKSWKLLQDETAIENEMVSYKMLLNSLRFRHY